MSGRKFIEEFLPLKEISLESVHEKNVRQGHIKNLHVWWAGRPIVACRAALLGSLLPAPSSKEEFAKILQFLIKFCSWETSNNLQLITKARHLILKNNGGQRPKILDCFAGGGAIPLEILRMGCEAHALELNPVAVLMELCLLNYPQKLGTPINVHSKQRNLEGEYKKVVSNRLAYDIERWGKLVLEEANKQIGQFYPNDPDGKIPVAYLWARTVKCPNRACGAEIPLIRKTLIVDKPNRKVALRIIPSKERKQVQIDLATNELTDLNLEEGTMKYGSVQCPVCKQGFKSAFLRREAMAGQMGQRLMAIVMTKGDSPSKIYRVAREEDMVFFEGAEKVLRELESKHNASVPLVPSEQIATPCGSDSGAFFVHLQTVNYGLKKWGDLFNSRQALALVTFSRLVKECYNKILSETQDPEYSTAVVTYLGLTLDSMAHYLTTSSTWLFEHMISAFIEGQAIAFRWDYAEANPFGERVGTWSYALNKTVEVLKKLSEIPLFPATVQQGTATKLPYDDSFFDYIITDPPYYDQIPYSDLSDFFYVWLKRTIGPLYPSLFTTPLTPKGFEIIQNSSLVRKWSLLASDARAQLCIKDKAFFEQEMTKALQEMKRVLKPEGLLAILFAHKTTTAWETLITALINAGFTVTSSWPLHTERPSRLRAHESAVLASSVWLICRKRSPHAGIGSWKTVQSELDTRVKERLEFFLSQGIKGADALLSAIGPAMEVFGRYEKVEKVTGEAVKTAEFLDKTREVVADHALAMLGNVDPETRFYAFWKWAFESKSREEATTEEGAEVEADIEDKSKNEKVSNGSKILIPYDDALKLARSVGAEPDALLKTHKLLKQEKEYVRLLSPAERKGIHNLGDVSRDGSMPPIIDMIHRSLNLWVDQEHSKLDEYLQTSGAATNETFWRVAQALSNLLPLQSREKQLLDGLLGRHAAGVSETGRRREDKTLDEFMMKDEVK